MLGRRRYSRDTDYPPRCYDDEDQLLIVVMILGALDLCVRQYSETKTLFREFLAFI